MPVAAHCLLISGCRWARPSAMRCWLHAGGRKHNISSLCVIINLRFEFEGGGRLSPFVTTEEKSRENRAASGGDGS